MAAHLIVRATVLEADRPAFDDWYQNHHLPDAKAAFGALTAQRGWCESDPALHIAIYTFGDLAQANAVAEGEAIQALIDDFDRTWQGRVTRTREVLGILQSI
ncbi:MAG: hypothetical protein AAGB15_01115 [Pseudomonadota bacterium]